MQIFNLININITKLLFVKKKKMYLCMNFNKIHLFYFYNMTEIIKFTFKRTYIIIK